MDAVEKIYYNMDRLHDDFIDLPETQQTREEFDTYAESVVPREKRNEFSDRVTSLASQSEKQRFLYGFRYALTLLMSGAGADIAHQ